MKTIPAGFALVPGFSLKYPGSELVRYLTVTQAFYFIAKETVAQRNSLTPLESCIPDQGRGTC